MLDNAKELSDKILLGDDPFSELKAVRVDEQAVPNAAIEDIVPELWQRFATARSREGNGIGVGEIR